MEEIDTIFNIYGYFVMLVMDVDLKKMLSLIWSLKEEIYQHMKKLYFIMI